MAMVAKYMGDGVPGLFRLAKGQRPGARRAGTGLAIEACDLLCDSVLIGGDDLACIFGIEPRSERRSIDEIAEHHGELTALGFQRPRRDRRLR